MASPPDAGVRTLLAKLGLSHLIGVFAEHEVDDAAFVQLKDADLRDINISRGNRRKILTAIQTIKERERQWAPSIVTPPPSPVTECSICMDASVEVRVVGCGHTMCSACAAAWFARTPAGQVTECPTCRGPCTDFEPLVPPAIELATTRPSPVPIVQSAVETPRHQIFVGRAYDMTTPQLIELFKEFGRVVDAFIMLDSAGRSKGCGIVEFSEPEAAARAIEVWRQKRHPRWSKLIVERARGRFADAAAETRAVAAGSRARAASAERADAINEALVRAEAAESRATDVASEALLCYEAAEARAVAAEARVALTEARARVAEARAVTALTRARAAEERAVAAETARRAGARAAEAARVRAYATASALRVENTELLAKLDALEAAAAAAAARAAETENQLKAHQGTTLDPTHTPPSPPFYVPTVPVHPPPMVLGPIAPGSLPWSWAQPLPLAYEAPPPPNTTRAHDAQAHKHTHAESAASYAEGHPDVDPGSFLRMLNEERNKACHGRRYPDIFRGTFIDLGYKSDTLKYGHFKVDNTQNTQNIVFVSPEDVPDGSLSEGDRCEFRIVEYRNQRNRRNGTFQRKAVDVVCIKRAVPVPPQPSC